MRAIALSVALLALASSGRAAVHDEIVDLFASMTAALSADNPAGFMKAFDRKMPQYGELNRQVNALVLDAEIASSVEPLKDEGTGAKRSVDLDWYLELRSRQPDGPTRRRREVIHCELELEGKHWRIVSLQPVSFFTEKLE